MHKVCHKYLDVKLQILIKKKLDSKKYILLKNLKIHISNYSHIEFPANQ